MSGTRDALLPLAALVVAAARVGAQDAAAPSRDSGLVVVMQPTALTAGDTRVPPGTRRPRSTRANLAIVGAFQGAAFVVTWALPEDVSLWDKSIPTSYYLRRAYGHPPVWDRDPFVWNWVIHPIAGQQAYLLERNEGRGPWRGVLVATVASVGWEYGLEAFIERPSATDLVVTSPLGSVLGELSWQATKRLRRNGVHGMEKAALVVVNPGWVMRWGFR